MSARQYKPAWVAAAALAGSAAVISAWPAASHWVWKPSHPAAAGQADALGVSTAGTQRSPARHARQEPAATQDAAASQQIEIVSVAVASRPGRHRKPGQAPDGYANPLRSLSNLVPERIDQGVDFSGSGPIYALGNAVVTSSADGYSTGWPGGGWITYRLTSGPDAGLTVYLAEDVTPTVQVGQHVSSSTVIANMFDGGDGIETGWAAQQTDFTAESQLPKAGGIGGGGPFPTEIGLNFDQLLQSLGMPAAPNSTQTAFGVLPPNYPAN